MAVTAQDRPGLSPKDPPTGEGLTFEKVWLALMETRQQIENLNKETDQKLDKVTKNIDNLGKQMGGLHNSFGELAEHLVAPGIVEKFNILGYHFDGVAPRGYEVRNDQGKIIAEVDMLLENGDFIIAVEVKTEPNEKDIERHTKRLEILRKHRDRKNDKRKIRGAIACAIFPNNLKELALEAGLYVLVQSGDTMKMDIPEDFVPKEW